MSEEQSKSNAGQIGELDIRKAPVPAESRGKQELQNALAENIPQTIEEVDNFKKDNKAGAMSSAVLSAVQGDKDEVVSTFSEIEKAPPPAPTTQIPAGLPAEEAEPVTPEMNLGEGAIVPLQPQHSDVSNFTREADAKLKEEGITQEQLDMVDSGDLAEAGKEKKGMEKMAKSEPASIQSYAKSEAEKVGGELKAEEKKERSALKTRRKNDLSDTSHKQKNTKNALEKKREKVAAQINSIYTVAQKSVIKKLADHETKSMKSFDEGSSRATSQFEDQVKSEMDAYKSERYKGIKGKLNGQDSFIGRKEQELQQKLAEKQEAAIKAIDDKIEKMKEAMSGALLKIGNLLLQAAKKFFTWALKQAGYSIGVIEGVLNKGASILKGILPSQFSLPKM